MTRTANGLWPQVIDFENLYAAYQEARKGKRYRAEVLRYRLNAEEHLANLQNHLIWKSWQPGQQREFVVREPKLRAIQAPPFEDRVLHHALVRVIEPVFERKFISDSYACRKGKGTQAAVQRVQHQLRVARRNWGDGVYVLKADISRFFASIVHTVLLREIGRAISDADVLWLYEQIIRGYGHGHGVGLPVGALTSQLGANVILNRLDHAAKDDMGFNHYVRYMDDFVVILPDKAAAQRALRELQEAVHSLGLALNPKTAIHPWQRGVDFCGYRIWPTHILPRKRNVRRARADFRRLAKAYAAGRVDAARVRQRVDAFRAYAKHCNARRTVEGVLHELDWRADAQRVLLERAAANKGLHL